MPNPELAPRDSVSQVGAEMSRLDALDPRPLMAEPIVPGELQKTVSIAFSGLLDDGVRKPAETVCYTVAITPTPAPLPGQAAAAPLTVSVSTGFVTALGAFSAIGDAAAATSMRLFFRIPATVLLGSWAAHARRRRTSGAVSTWMDRSRCRPVPSAPSPPSTHAGCG